MRPNRVLLVGFAALLAFGCVSRYKLPLYLDFDQARRSLKVEQTQYLKNARLGDPYDEQKVIAGEGHCLVLLTSTRGEKLDLPSKNLLGFDEYLKIRLFVELPRQLAPGQVTLMGHSFVQLLGRYSLKPEDKIYLPEEGNMVIDSLSKDHLYASVNGQFSSSTSKTLQLDGQFRVRVQR